MIPHMAYLAENNDFKDQKLFNNPDRSILTQPPLIAIAALEVYKRDPNTEILSTLYHPLKTYHDWFDRRRDPENDHLVAIIHPWESGWDASQRWDDFMDVDSQQIGLIDALDKKRKELTDLILAFDCDVIKIAARSDGFYVKPADFNAIRAADIEALADIGQLIGASEEEVENLKKRSLDVRQAIREKMIQVNKDRLLVHDISGQTQKIKSADSAAKFVLLFGHCVTEQQAELLRNELMGNVGHFNTPYRVPTTPTDNSTFDGEEYWRGNIWLPVNWLICRGLYNYGFVEEAQKLTQNSLDLVTEYGYREFFNPLTGQGGKASGMDCPQNQSWSTIVLDMLMTSLSSEL
jgi:glycogen debranching enzyme